MRIAKKKQNDGWIEARRRSSKARFKTFIWKIIKFTLTLSGFEIL